MQIKINKPNQFCKDQSENNSKQNKHIKMTLQQYLQSVNLKRKIKSRSKSRQIINKDQNNFEKNHLNPGDLDKTIQYFKLNQEWKARNTFNSWIMTVKQLCREYIFNDSHYVEIIRIIDKMADFVKNQIQSIKKDNLLLESYLVMDASYWPMKSSVDEENKNLQNKQFDKYFQHIPIQQSQFYKSTSKKQQQINQQLSIQKDKQNTQKQHRSSSQPKPSHHNSHHTDASKHPQNQSNTYRTSSTHTKNNNYSGSYHTHNQHSKTDMKMYQKHHIFSFQDKNTSEGDKFKVVNYNNQSKKNSQGQDSNVKEFNHHHNYLDDLQKKKYLKVNQLGLNIIQQQIPRLSLMSKYDQDISQRSTKSQIQENTNPEDFKPKIPLRERRLHQTKNIVMGKNNPVQIQNQFDQIFMRVESPERQINQQIQRKNRKQLANNTNLSQEKVKVSNLLQKQKDPEHSPYLSGNRTNINYDQTISLETPTTLKRSNLTKEQKQSGVYRNIIRDHSKGQKVNVVKSSQQDIIKRFDTFRNLG